VVIDRFSRFIELYAVPDTSAPPAAKCVPQHLGRYDVPRRIQTDNGSQFVNEMINELITLVGTEHQLTLVYSSEENAIVEHAKKEVLRHLRAIILDKKVVGEWSTTYNECIRTLCNRNVLSSSDFW
jgi:transposase InsO family protein